MKFDIVELARTAEFTPSPSENALLRALVEKGGFDGGKHRNEVHGADFAEDIRRWLPSVWTTESFYDEPAEADRSSMDFVISQDHDERIYTKAPFPIISGGLLSWVFGTEEVVRELRSITISNIRVSGDFDANCHTDCTIGFTECVFENRFNLSGHFRGGFVFSGDRTMFVYLVRTMQISCSMTYNVVAEADVGQAARFFRCH